jgi:hypothetical protein
MQHRPIPYARYFVYKEGLCVQLYCLKRYCNREDREEKINYKPVSRILSYPPEL